MALNFDTEFSYSRDENDFLEEVNAGLIQPYMFEPEYGEAELARTGNTTEPPVAKEDAYSRCVGHTDRCSCKGCGQMPSTQESLCCRDIAILADKRAQTGNSLTDTACYYRLRSTDQDTRVYVSCYYS